MGRYWANEIGYNQKINEISPKNCDCEFAMILC